MIFTAGDLRSRIKILKAANIRDASGNIIGEPYTTRCTVWANVAAQTASIQANSNEAVHEISTKITIRYNAAVKQTDRIMLGSRLFEQLGPPINLDEKSAWLQLICREVVPLG